MASGASPAMERRGFVKLLGGGALLLFAAPALSACDSITSTLDAVLEGKREVVDHAGRTVTVPTPDRLTSIYFTSAVGQIFCFTLAPKLLGGTGLKFTPQELAYLPEGTASLPYFGTLSGGESINRETLMSADVQLIFNISSTDLNDLTIEDGARLQEQTTIPVLSVDGTHENIASCYRFLGDILGLEARAEELAQQYETIVSRVASAVADLPASQKVSLYYAEGPEGLQTEPSTSHHAFAFELAGAHNVAEVNAQVGTGMSSVSLEQVLAWDPEVIIAWSRSIRGGADEEIRSSDRWKNVRAVRNGRVYTMPNAPFAWCDRPPGVNRLLGIQWLANLLYPKRYNVDMVDVVKDFYKTFYWVEINDTQAKDLLGNSYPPK